MVLKKKTMVRITIALSFLPALYILVGTRLGWLGFNPSVRAIEISGNWSIGLLLGSLAARPLKEIGIKFGMKIRKELGLASFAYGFLHLLFYVFWNYGGDIRLVLLTLPQQKFTFLGLGGLFILLVLTATSNKYSVRKLKKGWQRVHRFVYIAGSFNLFHLLLASKGNEQIFVIYGGIYLILMLARIPMLVRWIQKQKST